MSPEIVDVLVDLLANAGELAVFIVVALGMEWLVLGVTHRREREALRKERDFWREVGLKQMDQTGAAVGLLERLHS